MSISISFSLLGDWGTLGRIFSGKTYAANGSGIGKHCLFSLSACHGCSSYHKYELALRKIFALITAITANLYVKLISTIVTIGVSLLDCLSALHKGTAFIPFRLGWQKSDMIAVE
jgi:hypothetical protein